MADILIRHLSRRIPKDTLKAYADDLAVVTDNFQEKAKLIMNTFVEYERASGLGLNKAKVMVIPLWIEEMETKGKGHEGPQEPNEARAQRRIVWYDRRWGPCTLR